MRERHPLRRSTFRSWCPLSTSTLKIKSLKFGRLVDNLQGGRVAQFSLEDSSLCEYLKLCINYTTSAQYSPKSQIF